MRACMYACMQARMYVYIHICIHVNVWVGMYICICMSPCIYIYICKPTCSMTLSNVPIPIKGILLNIYVHGPLRGCRFEHISSVLSAGACAHIGCSAPSKPDRRRSRLDVFHIRMNGKPKMSKRSHLLNMMFLSTST